jgi:hypothetical protein
LFFGIIHQKDFAEPVKAQHVEKQMKKTFMHEHVRNRCPEMIKQLRTVRRHGHKGKKKNTTGIEKFESN